MNMVGVVMVLRDSKGHSVKAKSNRVLNQSVSVKYQQPPRRQDMQKNYETPTGIPQQIINDQSRVSMKYGRLYKNVSLNCVSQLLYLRLCENFIPYKEDLA